MKQRGRPKSRPQFVHIQKVLDIDLADWSWMPQKPRQASNFERVLPASGKDGVKILKPSAKKKSLKLGASAMFATGITLASRFDLAISSALAGLTKTENSFTLSVPKFAALLEIIGEWAPSVLAASSVLIIGQECAELCPEKETASKLASFLPATALMAYATSKTIEYMKYPLSGAFGAAMIAGIAFVIAAALYLLIGKIPDDIRKKVFLPAAYTLAASFCVLMSVCTVKSLWGRVRLRELVDMNSLADFTPWYHPKFFSGSHSFPSGHTAHATLLMMLPKWLSGKGLKYRPALTALCVGFVALMAFSRLAAGAHFLSDILFGFLIAFGITEVTKKCYDRHEDTVKKLRKLADWFEKELLSLKEGKLSFN